MQIQLDAHKKYLVAVSGGPDSMALLDMARKCGVALVVCHVNYKKRKSSDRDEKIVREYCHKYQIPCYVNCVTTHHQGNFQAWAREYRYDFFAEVYQKEHCDELLIAHQADDFLETYLSKKERHSGRFNPAIAVRSEVKGMAIYRPLLDHYKKELEQYCHDNDVSYGIDETNLQPLYHRNVIRAKLAQLDQSAKQALYEEAKHAQERLTHDLELAKQYYTKYSIGGELDVSKLLALQHPYQELVLSLFIAAQVGPQELQLSRGRIQDLLSKLKTNKKSFSNILSKQTVIERHYDRLVIKPFAKAEPFSYTLERFEPLQTPYFRVMAQGQPLEGIQVSPEDYPLTIRSYQLSDTVVINEGHKKVNRLFIDAKVPLSLRHTIPVVLNHQGEILLISGIYQEVRRKTLQSNVFVVKC